MRFAKINTVVIVLAFAAVSCFGVDSKKMKEKQALVESDGFAVVELFTSEGCSSCPAADDLVSKIQKENNQDVFILSYHVDYWNRLGWKDEFSKAAFSERQKQYARSMALKGVYTPQIVVNGTIEFVGSNEERLRSSIKNSQSKSSLSITTQNIDGGVKLSYSGGSNKPMLLNIALVQPEAYTNVGRGENSGRKLHHVNIVRELKTINTSDESGSIDMQIPKELANLPLKLIAFTQQKDDMKIVSVAAASVAH